MKVTLVSNLNLRKTRRAMARAIPSGLRKASRFLLQKSREQVPVDTGYLKKSSDAFQDPLTRGARSMQQRHMVAWWVTYYAYYAPIVHERVGAKFGKKRRGRGKAKFLEDPAKQHIREMTQILALEIVKEFRKLGGGP